jgi:protein-S-isoprenylcysteine O-methyltransferase Ste14
MNTPATAPLPPLIRYGNACFKHRGLMLPAAVLLLFVPSATLLDNALITSMLGLLLALVGQGIRIGTIGLVYIIRGGKNHHVYADTLVTGGLYSHVRNPMYLGNCFLLAGLVVASNAWVFFIGGIAIAVAVHIGIIAAEEHFLRNKFGQQYEDFCARVPRLIPRLGGLGRTFGDLQFNWGRVVDKEFMQPVDWTSAAAIVSTIALYRSGQLQQGLPLVVVSAVLVVLRVVLWLQQRARKRTAA